MNSSGHLAGAAPRCAVVTGAAGGIGRALAAEFERAGYRVIATDMRTRPEGLVCSHYMHVDVERTVADEAYAAEVFDQIRLKLGDGGLDVLINNAAVQILGGIDSLTRADWGRTLDVNLVAPFVWTQALLPELESARGSVVNVSSIHARLTKRDFVAYATSKAALSGMTRALAVDLRGRVRVNAVEPAAVATPMLEASFAGRPGQYKDLQACHPAGRIGLPVEVARAALFLCDSAAAFINGETMAVDGGIGAVLHDPAEAP